MLKCNLLLNRTKNKTIILRGLCLSNIDNQNLWMDKYGS